MAGTEEETGSDAKTPLNGYKCSGLRVCHDFGGLGVQGLFVQVWGLYGV